MNTRLTPGQRIRVRAADTGDDWCHGRVMLVGGTSAVFSLDSMVHVGSGFIGGFLPLIIDYEAETVRGLFGGDYEVEVTEEDSQQ